MNAATVRRALKKLIETHKSGSIDNSSTIFDFLSRHQDRLFVEDILEALNEIGHAPSLLNSDTGTWAVGGDGAQNLIGFEKNNWDMRGVWWLKEEDWQPTIRRAIKIYLTKGEDTWAKS